MAVVTSKTRTSGGIELSGGGPPASALPMPILAIGAQQEVLFANPAAEQFFDTSAAMLRKQSLTDLIPFDSPLLPAERIVAHHNRTLASIVAQVLPAAEIAF